MTAKSVVKSSWAVACCSSSYLQLLNIKCYHRILCIVLCGTFNCQAVCQFDLHGLHNGSCSDFIHLTFSGWLSSSVFSCTNANSLIKQFIPLVNWYFCWRFPPYPTQNLLYTAKTDLDSWNNDTHLAIFTWDTIFTLQVERYENSSSTNYKFDHITCSNAFSFHSCTFQFMSNVKVNRYIFQVYILFYNAEEQTWKQKWLCIFKLHFQVSETFTIITLFLNCSFQKNCHILVTRLVLTDEWIYWMLMTL